VHDFSIGGYIRTIGEARSGEGYVSSSSDADGLDVARRADGLDVAPRADGGIVEHFVPRDNVLSTTEVLGELQCFFDDFCV